VPPFAVEGFTTLVTPALNAWLPAAALLWPGLALLEPLLELLLEHAARLSAPRTAQAANARGLRLFIKGTSPFT